MSEAGEYYYRVERWKKRYLPGLQKGQYNPAQIVVRQSREQCAKCKSWRNINRHHKGHEYLFACIREDLYASRYVQFHPDDLVSLCKDCHLHIHKLYKQTVFDVNSYVYECFWNQKEPQFEVLEEFRKKMVRQCESWLRRKPRKRGSKKK